MQRWLVHTGLCRGDGEDLRHRKKEKWKKRKGNCIHLALSIQNKQICAQIINYKEAQQKTSSSAITFTIVTIIISDFSPTDTCWYIQKLKMCVYKNWKSVFKRRGTVRDFVSKSQFPYWATSSKHVLLNPHFQSHNHVINFPYPSPPSTQTTCGSPVITTWSW